MKRKYGLKLILPLVLLIVIMGMTIVDAYTEYKYYETALPLVGERTLATGIKTDSSVETADNNPGYCQNSFLCRIDRLSGGSWVENSADYLMQSYTPQAIYYKNVTEGITVRLRAWRYGILNGGVVQGSIWFY